MRPASAGHELPAGGIRILLADDHALVRAGVRQLLDRTRGVAEVIEARDGREAVSLALLRRPHVALVEVALSGLNGLEVAQRLARRAPGVRVILFSRQSSEESVARALRAGAAGFLVKDATPRELELAIEAVARGGAWLSPSISRAVIDRYLKSAKEGAEKPDLLTARQREILQLVAEGSGNKEVARVLGVSIKTVETHRAHLMKRLNIRDLAGLVRYAVRNGIVSP